MPDSLASVGSPLFWGGFAAVIIGVLALDLGVFHRKSHAVGFREAGIWSCVWITLALGFNAWIWFAFGSRAATDFLTGYLIEYSLSVDNIFVFVVVFSSLKIPAVYQHRVLFWGIMTALVLRGIMIFAGVALIQRFHWLIYVFGAFLIITGLKLFRSWKSDHEDSPEDAAVMRWMRKLIPTTKSLHADRFLVRVDGKLLATPLLITLLLVEFTDVIFALDSIPAIFAITLDPFIVFTSNIFAILGLRSLYFLLAGMVDKFRYLKIGLAFVLVFVGVKMTIVDVLKIPAGISLAVIILMLGTAIWFSFRHARLHGPEGEVKPS